MKREELTALNVPEEAIDKIMSINGEDVEKHKAATVAAQAKAAELTAQLSQRDADITALKKVDAAGLQSKLAELQGKYDADKKAWDANEQKRAYEARRQDFFSGVVFADEYAKRGVMAEFDERAMPYSDADKTFAGGKDWLTALREKSPSSFKEDNLPTVVRPTGGTRSQGLPRKLSQKRATRSGATSNVQTRPLTKN